MHGIGAFQKCKNRITSNSMKELTEPNEQDLIFS